MFLLVGFLVGLALGLTGAGGSIVAVPLLMLLLEMRPQDAMGVSLGAVSAAAMVGVLLRRRNNEPPQWSAALGLAITGMMTAPLGRWLANRIDEHIVLGLFSCLALFLAIRMWRGAGYSQEPSRAGTVVGFPSGVSGRAVFICCGFALGLLAGLLGVGGGFLIVPFLTLYAGLQIEKAISTSLLVIALVGSSGYVYHVMSTPAQDVAALTVIASGSILGILAGTSLGARLSGPRLQRVFSGFVLMIMTYTLLTTVLLPNIFTKG